MNLETAKRMQAERPDIPVSVAGGLCWYLTGTGEIIRGQVVRDGSWEDRKGRQLGGLTFLGHAEYGPGGDCLPALLQFLPEHPELQPIIDRAREVKKQHAYERANREEVKRQKKMRDKAEEAAMMADAIRLMQEERQAAETDEDTQTGREPGRAKRQR